ncbi:MAG: helix-turn-helix transcriptional regulator [Ferrovibrio sp.]|uniref:helix-turn-helix transcriptional regulator n=1 Tax=Ferrovibrio sp. TaxID=1917215 RepID=UPI00391DA2B5
MTENPNRTTTQDAAAHDAAMRDVLSDVLRCIRLSGSLQFCFMPAGDWETDDTPALSRCLALIHEDPQRDWNVQALSGACGLSRSSLAERFEAMLQTSPMRYVRDWRLCQASVALSTTSKPVAAVAFDAGYGTEAAFSRAFARAYGLPPAAWRQHARRGLSA